MTEKPGAYSDDGRRHGTMNGASFGRSARDLRLDSIEGPGSSNRPLRVCIASSEFLGPFRCGGIGTAYTKIGELLQEAGHDVTFLYTGGDHSLSESNEHWIDFYAEKGIRFVPLPDNSLRLYSLTIDLAKSYRTFLWLREHDDFDVVHFPDYGAPGYHSLLAKHQGLALARTTTVVGLHGSSEWTRFANQRLTTSPSELEQDFIERRAAELADIVWSPGQYMFDWVKSHGWKLQKQCHQQPYVVPAFAAKPRAHPVSEVVFFGRQEVRKGLLIFLDALDRIAAGSQTGAIPDFQVTILGKATHLNGADSEEMVRARSAKWPFPTRIIADCDQEQAIAYLKGEGRLAVIPSIVENYPNTVLECLACQVPFLASRVGGIPEQIHPDDIESVCFDPTPRHLAERLKRVLREGHATARLSFDPEQNSRDWVRWHARVVDDERRDQAATDPFGGGSLTVSAPTISVCLTHYNRPHFLRQALDSIVGQDMSPLEVIVVDDGSPDASVQDALDSIVDEYDFAKRGWRLVRQENRYLGAARNRAAAEARGDYLLFMDDDNAAKPHEISTFTAAARHTGADVLTCLMDIFSDETVPGVDAAPDVRVLFTGANFPLSVFYNTFGDANAIIRRSAFLGMGGYSEDYGVGHEDWELFSRMLLTGYQIEIVPDALFWYREMPGSMVRSTSLKANYLRSLRPYLEEIPAPYHRLIEMCLGRSLIERGVLEGDGQARYLSTAVTESIPPPWPLRYKIMDWLNERFRRFKYLHKLIKKTIAATLMVRKRIKKNQLDRAQRLREGRFVVLHGPRRQLATHFAAYRSRAQSGPSGEERLNFVEAPSYPTCRSSGLPLSWR